MCRLAAYLGQEISLNQFLNAPEHSLVKQSWAPEEMTEARLNADGFGFCWYLKNASPVTYLNTAPIWSDINLPGLASSINSQTWLGYVRSATPGQLTSIANTQPYIYKHISFIHNGFIKTFNPEVKTRFHEILSANIQAEIHGDTDSEYLFALIRQILAKNPDKSLSGTLIELCKIMPEITGDSTTLVNIILGDGNSLVALRHAINGSCPTLYFSENNPVFPGGKLFASEKLTRDDSWTSMPEHSITIISSAHKTEIIQL